MNLLRPGGVLAASSGLCAYDRLRTLAAARRRSPPSLGALGRLVMWAPPDGAFYVYANIERFSDDSMAMCKEILTDTGVVLAPGIDFDPENGHRYIRFSFAVSTAETREAIARLAPWFKARART